MYKKVRPVRPAEKMDHLVKSVNLTHQWANTASTIKRLFESDKIKGKAEYERQMGELQMIIKKHQHKFRGSLTSSVIKIAKEFEGITSAKILTAGYELVSGNDFSSKLNSHG